MLAFGFVMMVVAVMVVAIRTSAVVLRIGEERCPPLRFHPNPIKYTKKEIKGERDEITQGQLLSQSLKHLPSYLLTLQNPRFTFCFWVWATLYPIVLPPSRSPFESVPILAVERRVLESN